MAGVEGVEPSTLGFGGPCAARLRHTPKKLVRHTGFEPAASRSQAARSTSELMPEEMVGDRGFGLLTSRPPAERSDLAELAPEKNGRLYRIRTDDPPLEGRMP